MVGLARKIADFLRMLIILGLVAVASAWLAKQSEVSYSGVPRFVDGDSLFLAGEEIRMLGIDAPEYNQTCLQDDAAASFACGKQALVFLKQIARGGDLVCEGWEHDKYDRLLATCYSGDLDLNREMVLKGWAVSFGDYEAEELIAKREQRGLWAGSFDAPSRWRRQSNEAHAGSWISRLKFW